MAVSRRRFLQGTLGVSGALMLDGAPWSRALVRAGGLPSPAESGLDHIVVIMMENRSADHYLGWMPGMLGWADADRARGGDGTNPGGLFAQPRRLLNPDGSGAELPRGGNDECPQSQAPADTSTVYGSYRFAQHCHVPDPDHGWYGSRAEFNYGRMDGFVHATPDDVGESDGHHVAMGKFTAEDLTFHAWAATGFTTFANYFCSVMGPTYPNREFLHTGQSGAQRSNTFGPAPTGWTFPTIWESLERAGVSWRYYFTDLPVIGLWAHLLAEHPDKIRHTSFYYADAAAGQLPSVCFVDPGFEIGFDDHPAADVKRGQRFLYDTFMALATGPQWTRSAMVVTYDEPGGFHDPVVPPVTYDPLATPGNLCDDFGQLGGRVPTMLLSPFARRGLIADGGAPFDHASVLAMINWRFGLPPCSTDVEGTGLPSRDAYARNLAEVMNFDNPITDLPEGLVPPDVHAQGAYCLEADETSVEVVRDTGLEDTLHDLPPVNPPYPGSAPNPPGIRHVVPVHAHPDLVGLAEAGYFGPFDLRHVPANYAFRS
jgi:phospholipase C